MARAVIVLVGDEELKANLRALGGRTGSAGLAKAVNRVAFDVRDAEGQEVRSSLRFAGAGTESFLSRGIRFDPATPADLTAIVRPLPKSEPILVDQATGPTITAADELNERLGLKDVLAVPIGVKRDARGRVKRSETPGALLARYGKKSRRRRPTRGLFRGTVSEQVSATARPYVFVNRARTVLLEAVAGSISRVLYALIPKAKLDKRFAFLEVATKEARAQFPKKVEDELRKVLAGLAIKGAQTRR